MKIKKTILISLLFAFMFIAESCGPIVISSRPDVPPPAWFYPNRVEAVRYVYFPDYMIYYDLSLRHYIYLNNNVWITVNTLPTRYNHINLNRSKFVRIKNYRGDNISRYHTENRTNTNRTNVRTRRN
ncbi:hypothetical protein [Olleya namhaensis]|uniref:hypothetical protein n=1 Tax=Olleya namhaensis TaxID=1144750 RepID=UPI00232D9DB5|nr:hypothetical protein [Olleya namhaensis]